MVNNEVPNPLSDLLKSYCNVNAPSINELAQDLRTSVNPEIANKFRQQLDNAIRMQTITPEQYEALTGEDFDTQEDLTVWLKELWSQLYEQQD